MKYYIDYENVNSVGLDGIESLNENDEIFIYYSGSNMTMKMDFVSKLLETKARIVLEHVQNGTANALDFQMIVNIFCDIEANDHYVIISRDKGYDAAINAGKRKGFNNGFRADSIRHYLNRKENIVVIERKEVDIEKHQQKAVDDLTKKDAENIAVTADNDLDGKNNDQVQELCWVSDIVSGKCNVSLSLDDTNVIIEALEKARGKYAKNLFYQHFVSKFGAKEGRDFYSKIKPAYEELRKNYRSLHACEK